MTDTPANPHGRTRLVVWGTCDTGKPRMRILLQGLHERGVEVIECRADIWRGIEDKSSLRGPLAWLGLAVRAMAAYPALLWRYLRLPSHDWVLLGYPAFIDVFLIWPLARLRRARIALDWFLSAYDTIVLDRAIFGRSHPFSLLVRLGERIAVRGADRPFMDTASHARRMERMFGLPSGRVGHVMVGVEDRLFATPPGGLDARPPVGQGRLKVLFYGQFIPLHGIPTIIAAATLLKEAPVDWILIGKGQEAPKVRAMLEASPVPALRWRDWVEYPLLRREIQSAHVCLGIFGTSDKAASVIPNKVFQVLAAGKPVITRDSPAIRELLDHAPPCVRLVPPGDPQALAAAVRQALEGRLDDVSGCHHSILPRITPAAVASQFLAVIAATTGPEGQPQ